MNAPTAYAASLDRMSGTPIMVAASSSSRIASQARPRRPSRMRSETKTQNAATRTKTTYFAVTSNGPSGLEIAIVDLPMAMLAGPNGSSEMLSSGAMPLAPLDRLKPWMFSALRKICGMISPNPRVTSAR